MQIFAQLFRNFTCLSRLFWMWYERRVEFGMWWVRASPDLVTTRVALLAPGDLQKKQKRTDRRTDRRTRLQQGCIKLWIILYTLDYRAKCIDNGDKLPIHLSTIKFITTAILFQLSVEIIRGMPRWDRVVLMVIFLPPGANRLCRYCIVFVAIVLFKKQRIATSCLILCNKYCIAFVAIVLFKQQRIATSCLILCNK